MSPDSPIERRRSRDADDVLLGPINISPQAVKTWGFVSTVQRYTPTQQYRQTLRQSRTRTAHVIDSQTKQAWLVPMLSLLLHLCHVYTHRITNDGATMRSTIPYAAPSCDGAQAVIDAIERAGDLVVLGQEGEPDTETLRQLFLRMHTSLVQAASLRVKSTRRAVYATELMAVIDPPLQGSGLRKIDVSGPNSLIGSWGDIVKHVDVVGVCGQVGQATGLVVVSPATCLECRTLPAERFYLAAHVRCLENLVRVAGGTLDDLPKGECQLGFKTVWCAGSNLWARCSSSTHKSPCDAQPTSRVLQRLSSQRPKSSKPAVLQDSVSKDGVVVLGDDCNTFRPLVVGLMKFKDSYRRP
ncbi:hypothetical protein Micbo1qcDRAFT_215117 [Microdochium bolleyi]|uniref:Uncharacterized protein n=1 Tax=Microdochium bolleyi TaxID=196109 RepID=A0A136ISC1_9PEZI|nr:hypothetical protein Micbo1qcDRAFT_215117 [Microdochium bolleyi]